MNAKRPNILLITTDTQRWDSLNCMGNPWAISPNLDRLARQGVLFEQGHTNSPVCGPARCCLLTGTHVPIHGAIENNFQRRTELTPFTDHLAQAGYRNIMVGKTHFKGPIPDSFHAQHVLQGEKSANNDDFYGQHMARHGHDRGTAHPNPVGEDIFCDAFLTDVMIDELRRHQSGAGSEPFFAFLSMLSPHGPIDPPGRWATLYDDVQLPPLNYVPGETERHPQAERELTLFGRGLNRLAFPDGRNPDMNHIDRWRKLYYGLCAYCDHQVGRLMTWLDEAGLRENTLVIFTSDHGTTLFDHGFENKHTFFDSSWRVPMILSMPSVLPVNERRGFAMWTDLTATILAAAGVECDTVQGFNLFDPLRRMEPSPRQCAIGGVYETVALATQRWKLEYCFLDGNGRLFDRANDPCEQTDLYRNDANREVRDHLLRALLTWRGELTDIQGLRQRKSGGGVVATHLNQSVHKRTGLDAEMHLQERVGEVVSMEM